MTHASANARLLAALDPLFGLNPDLPPASIQELYDLARACPAEDFPEVAVKVGLLVETYLDSPHKRAGAMVLEEYFQVLERSARLLAERGELDGEAPAGQETESVALVPRGLYSPLTWARILQRAALPPDLTKAAESCRRRHELVAGVLEYAFLALHLVDSPAAFAWELDYLKRHAGKLDPDLLRDLLRAWIEQAEVPEAAFGWALVWSDDQKLVDQWSRVPQLADRLLARHALGEWQRRTRPRNSRAAQLKVQIARGDWDAARVREWVQAALAEIGDAVQDFLRIASGDETVDRAAASPAVMREIRRLEALFEPMLLAANLLLELPDGGHHFALAFFGLVGKGREAWDLRLRNLAEAAVRRMFLRGLRERRKPIEIIHELTFGDRGAFMRMLGELDFATASFDSIKQRERVVRYLAVFYASYREAHLLAAEVARRYRNLMRLLHEDNLARVLLPEHLAEARASNMVRELASIAADARRFLARRRDLARELEEMVAEETVFLAGVRRRRLALVRRFLLAGPPTAGK